MRRTARALLNRLHGGETDSVEALRRTWSHYAQVWDRRPDLNLGMETLGDEWGGPAFAERIVADLTAPYLGADVDVLELGCGGGKFSALLRARTRRLVCADISPDMLARARVHVGDGDDVEYHQLNGHDFTGVPDRSVDMIFSYDVLLHLQPQNIFSYLHDARRILRPHGIFMLHAINLASPGGSHHFEDQYLHDQWRHGLNDLGRLGYIYFMSEDQLRALATLARFSVDRMVTGWPPPGDPMHEVTRGRDTFGFLRREDGIQEQAAQGGVRLVRAPDEQLFAIVCGRRRPIRMAEIVEKVGLSLDDLEPVDAAELAAMPLDDPITRWEA
jgi:SAM-dependent methyltransferase